MVDIEYKAVIWDLGGVLVRTETQEPRRRWEAELGLSPGELSELVFDSPIARDAMHGRSTAADVWNWLADEFKLSQETRDRLIQDFWSGDRLDADLVAFIRQIKTGWKTGLITNAFPEIREDLDKNWRLSPVFDTIYVSAEVGITKPDFAIYEMSLRSLSISASEAIFVDDFAENITAANQLGMTGVQFVDPVQAKGQIELLLQIEA